MKKLCFLLLMSWVVMDVTAQNVVYSNLKGLLACEGDTVASLKVEKRTKNHILMTGGADQCRAGRFHVQIPEVPLLCRAGGHFPLCELQEITL